MASDAADALVKTYARNKKFLSLGSITNGLQRTGLLVAYTHRASVHLDPPLSAQRCLLRVCRNFKSVAL